MSAFLALVACAAPALPQAVEYTVVDLSLDLPLTPAQQPVYPVSRASGLNAAGAVVVTGHRSDGRTDAVVWDAGAVDVVPLVDGILPTGIDGARNTGGIRTAARPGWYVGSAGPVCVPEPVWCTSSLYFYATSRVLALEEGGRFTGDLSVPAPPGSGIPYLPQVEAYSASFSGGALQVTRLGTFNGLSTVGWGINELGEVAGVAGTATSAQPVVYRQGQFFPLPVLRLAQNRATALNTVGQVVGYVSDALPSPGFNACEGAVWGVTDPTAPTLLTIGQWSGSNRTALQDINDAGVAVGFAAFNQVSVEVWRRAVRWDATRGVIALDTLLGPGSQWEISEASAINAAGQITATGRLAGSLPRAIRLDPVVAPGLTNGGGHHSGGPVRRAQVRRVQ